MCQTYDSGGVDVVWRRAVDDRVKYHPIVVEGELVGVPNLNNIAIENYFPYR